MGWGMWGLRWQGDAIQQHAKRVWFGQKVQKLSRRSSVLVSKVQASGF